MRVKVIEIEGPEARFPPRAAAVESELQVWLNDNPNASIEHVAQSPMLHGTIMGSSGSISGTIWPTSVLVTIFYRD